MPVYDLSSVKYTEYRTNLASTTFWKAGNGEQSFRTIGVPTTLCHADRDWDARYNHVTGAPRGQQRRNMRLTTHDSPSGTEFQQMPRPTRVPVSPEVKIV